jgi:hypothetical protein
MLENEKKTTFRIIQRADGSEPNNVGVNTLGRIFQCVDETVPDKYRIYSPPFLDFPNITSHMHPHLALYNLCEKIERLYGEQAHIWLGKYRTEIPHLRLAWTVYEQWMKAEIPSDFMTKEIKEINDDDAPGSGVGSHSASGSSRSPPSHPRTRSQVTRSSKTPSRRGDGVSPQDSTSCVEVDSDGSSDDDGDDEEEMEESWSNLKKRVNMWRKSISPGLEPEHNTSCQELSGALAIQKVPSRDSDGSGTLVTQTGHVSAPEKLPGVLDVHSSVLSPLST